MYALTYTWNKIFGTKMAILKKNIDKTVKVVFFVSLGFFLPYKPL